MPKEENTKRDILNKNFQFQRVYRNGRSYVSPYVVTYVLPKQGSLVRYGITASKKVGCAVERNRARRVIKAAFIGHLPSIKGAFDLVFVARRAAATIKSTKLSTIIFDHLKKAGLF